MSFYDAIGFWLAKVLVGLIVFAITTIGIVGVYVAILLIFKIQDRLGLSSEHKAARNYILQELKRGPKPTRQLQYTSGDYNSRTVYLRTYQVLRRMEKNGEIILYTGKEYEDCLPDNDRPFEEMAKLVQQEN